MDVPQCALNGDARKQQLARYRRLAGSMTSVERTSAAMGVRFDASLDRDLLDDTVRIEHACCPFFAIAFDERARLLTISVAGPDHAPALDALAWALGDRTAEASRA